MRSRSRRLLESDIKIMRIKNRRIGWALALGGVALLPIGMTLAVVAAFAKGPPPPPAPKVVAAWAGGPMEVRVAFDRAVDPVVAAHLVGHAVSFGGAGAGGSLGAGRPSGDGGSIRIAAARLDDSGRTLVLMTDPHPREATYSLTIAEIKSPGDPKFGRSEVVLYTLSGIEATWTPEGDSKPAWAGWWPDLDPAAVQAMLAGSVEHEQLWPLLKQPGKLSLRSLATLPRGVVQAVIDASAAFEATFGTESARSDAEGHATLKFETTGDPADLTITLTTPPSKPELTLHWAVTPANLPAATAQALPRSAYELTWAPPTLLDPPVTALPDSLASGGDPARGAVVFASEQAKCSTCHQVRGQGGQVGPDLSNLVGVSRAWVHQNIVEPSASIHPDYVSYTVTLKDGRISMGIVRAEGADHLRVSDIDAKFTTFPRAEVEELRPSASSIMPVGLLGALGEEQTRDLLAYLTDPPAPKQVP